MGKRLEQLTEEDMGVATKHVKRYPMLLDINKGQLALAGVAQWIEHRPENQRVAGSSPSQGTCLGCRPGPQLEAQEATTH